MQVRDVEFLRANTDKPIKITVPGPFTMSQQAQDDYYKDEVALGLDYAAAVNEEIAAFIASTSNLAPRRRSRSSMKSRGTLSASVPNTRFTVF